MTSQNASRWAELLGPVTTAAVAAQLLGITRQSLARARHTRSVLAMRSTDGHWVYPLGQFRVDDGRIRVLDRLDDVLAALDTDDGGADAARWLATPNRCLDAATPWAALADGYVDAVIAAARRQARACGR